MNTVQELLQTDFKDIPIDQEWNFDTKKENKMHQIHAYPAKFPAFITKNSIDYTEKQGKSVNVIGDIFCGCGTTAYEALLNNKDFWGCDINPVAVLIAKTKSHQYREVYLIKYFYQIEHTFKFNNISNNVIDSVNTRIHYWFDRIQIEDLLKIKLAIDEVIPAKSKYKYFFQTAFSNILKITSKWLQKSIKPTIDLNKSICNVWQMFEKQFNIMRMANEENIKNSSKKNTINIQRNNVLNLRINGPKVDLLVTSPPYVTSYEYADIHQLSLLWLDFTDDFKTLRKGTVGSIYQQTDFNKNKRLLNKTATKIVDNLLTVDKRRSRNTAKYFVDIQKSLHKVHLLVKPGGYAVFVIGNTEYKQIEIDNAKHLVESMINVGFTDIEVVKRKISNKLLTPYRTKEGKFSSNETDRKIYAEEFIVIGKNLNRLGG